MGWLASIGVGLCSGVIGFIITLFAAAWAVELYRIPQREGAAGFFAFGLAIFVFFAGVVLGIVCARLVPQGDSPPFWRAVGTASAVLGGVAAVALALAWLLSDPAPKIGGQRLELVIELRCPPTFVMPELADPSDAYATIIRLPSGDTSRWSRLELDQARTEDGRLIIPTVLSLDTSVPRKLLSIRLGKDREVQFAFEFGAKPAEKDMQWTRWIDAAYPAGAPQPAADATFHMRYRVQKEPPPAKVLTREEEEAQRLASIRANFSALAPDAPLAAWLEFTHYRNPEDVQKAAGASIRKRPRFNEEMSEALRGEDKTLARLALWSFQFLPEPPAAVAPAVASFGEKIIASLREFSQRPVTDPPVMEEITADHLGEVTADESLSGHADRRAAGEEISSEFSDWMEAVRALQEQANVSFVSQLQEIAIHARNCQDDHNIRMSVVRVASFYLNKWAGIAPLPGDPPPR
jgi:hypothetical protein